MFRCIHGVYAPSGDTTYCTVCHGFSSEVLADDGDNVTIQVCDHPMLEDQQCGWFAGDKRCPHLAEGSFVTHDDPPKFWHLCEMHAACLMANAPVKN